MLMRYSRLLLACSSILVAATVAARAADNPFLGSWALTLPGGVPGWLGVEESNGAVKADLLWGWGSVETTASAKVADGRLVITRNHTADRKDASGKKVKITLVETITGTVEGDQMRLSSTKPKAEGPGADKTEFVGRRTPPPPAGFARRSGRNASRART